jgi:hypothetical protein
MCRLEVVTVAMGDDGATFPKSLLGFDDGCNLSEVFPIPCLVLALDQYDRCAAGLYPDRFGPEGQDQLLHRSSVVGALAEHQDNPRFGHFK